MTRETKIGMLVGLGVIVLIGVLLSEYLGTGPGGQQNADLGKFRGEQYRATVTHDVGLPNPQGVQPANGEPVVKQDNIIALASSQDMGSTGPVTVAPMGQQEGAIPPEMRLESAPPVALNNDHNEATFAPADAVPVSMRSPSTVVIKLYLVQKNDTVKSVAKKVYGASGAAEISRLVAANPGVIKDANSMLVAGKKLNIPVDMAQAPAPQVVAPPAVSPTQPPRPAQPAVTLKQYKVEKGDTISSIAKKTLGTGGPIATGEILKANGLAPGAVIVPGTILKIPVKTASR